MGQKIFVKVVGFSQAERDALPAALTAGQHEVAYALWSEGLTSVAHAVVIDDQVPEAQQEAEAARVAAMVVVWAGAGAPEHAWRSFARPLDWSRVLLELDELFAPVAEELDFDLVIDEEPDRLSTPDIPLEMDAVDAVDSVDTVPPETVPPAQQPPAPPRALIATASLDERLYLRAKLSLHGVTLADDAETAAQALGALHMRHYDVVLLDLALDAAGAWAFLKHAAACHPGLLVAIKAGASWVDRQRARAIGAAVLLGKPLDPLELQRLLIN